MRWKRSNSLENLILDVSKKNKIERYACFQCGYWFIMVQIHWKQSWTWNSVSGTPVFSVQYVQWTWIIQYFLSNGHPTWAIRCKIVFETTFLLDVSLRNAVFRQKIENTKEKNDTSPTIFFRNFILVFSIFLQKAAAKHSEEMLFGIRYCNGLLLSDVHWTKNIRSLKSIGHIGR